jgi:hypothetical protein
MKGKEKEKRKSKEKRDSRPVFMGGRHGRGGVR